MRDRLIELINNRICATKIEVERIADYLLENGVIVLPCKLGDTMYDISEFVKEIPRPEMYEDKVGFIAIRSRKNGEMYFDIECVECDYNDFGKTLFLTREEAEQALKGGAE